MSRPHAGYSINRKIKSAKKSIAHLEALVKSAPDEDSKTKLKERIDFWNTYIVAKTPDPKATRTKK